MKRVYAAYPEALHAPAAATVSTHLIKLEREGRVAREGDGEPMETRWSLV